MRQQEIDLARQIFLDHVNGQLVSTGTASTWAEQSLMMAEAFYSQVIDGEPITKMKLKGCMACHGSGGKKNDPCRVCHGTGKVAE